MHIRRSFLALCLVAAPAFAQVTGRLEDVPGSHLQNAFDYQHMGAYHGSVLYKDDVYAMYYHGSAPRNLQTNDPYAATGWEWAIPCNVNRINEEDIPVVEKFECNDRVFFAWKHLSCTAGGACGANQNWNVYPKRSNYPSINYQMSGGYPGAPTTGVKTIVNWSTANGFTYNYLPYTAGNVTRSTHAGAGYPNVIYARGRYFGVFDVIVGGARGSDPGACDGMDNHRMAWGYSSDGVTWTFAGFIYRDISETWSHCAGAVGQQLFFDEESSTFYLAFMSLLNSQIYLMKAGYSTAAPYFTSWQMPIGADTNGNWNSWTTLPNYRTSGTAPAVDPRTKLPLIEPSQVCSVYAPRMGFAKVYRTNSPTETQFRWILLVDISSNDPEVGPPQCSNITPTYPLRLYSSQTLLRTQSAYSDINAAQNVSHLQNPADYGWMPQFVWIVPNAVYARQADPVTIFVNWSETPRGRNKNLGRLQLNLSGEIFIP